MENNYMQSTEDWQIARENRKIMKVNNTQTMQVLLSTLMTAENFHEEQDKIVIEITREQLMYAMVSSEPDVQHIFGDTQEWDELTMLWNK